MNVTSNVTSENLRILACQVFIPPTPTVTERNLHLERMVQLVESALQEEPADLVVLPELSGIEYSRSSFGNLSELAETLDGPTCQAWKHLAKVYRTTIVFGMPRTAGSGYCISQVIAGPDGKLIGHYDKLHLAQYGASMEKEYFSRGDRVMTFTCKGFRIAPVICYDIRHPELFRTLALRHNVQLVLHCGAYARDESFHTWHPFIITRAMENQMFMLSLNRAGENFGHSLFCPPWVDENTTPTEFPEHNEALMRFTVDASVISEVRENYTFLRDRFDDYDAL